MFVLVPDAKADGEAQRELPKLGIEEDRIMSELKADKTFVFGEECEAYKKYEADKVIAELKTNLSEIQSQKMQLEDDVALLRHNNAELKESAKNLILDNYLQNKEIRRQKYKRCLALAMWCWSVKELNRYGDQDYMDFAEKWRQRWLKIAEKFKEAK
jgi:hypothetical protein